MKLNISSKTKAMLASYARSFLGASIAVYMTGNQSPRDILAAGAAALVPVLLRWVNANDPAFGRDTQ